MRMEDEKKKRYPKGALCHCKVLKDTVLSHAKIGKMIFHNDNTTNPSSFSSHAVWSLMMFIIIDFTLLAFHQQVYPHML